ncbi:MAG: sporulation protein [Coriobacteriia bacterium]
MQDTQSAMESWKDNFSVRRVFGEPIEREGVVVIPVAAVAGGGGSGTGPAAQGQGGEAGGVGFGGMAKPAGVYVITGEKVEWQPAIDVARLAITGMLVSAFIALIATKALHRG